MAILGLILLIGVVAIASIGILLVAGQTTDDVKQQAETDRVEQSFVQMSKELETASSSQDVSRATDLDVDTEQGQLEFVENGEIDIRIDDDSIFDGPIQLHSIEYTAADGTIVAYQGGGIWRGVGEKSVSVSEPNVHFRDQTLNFPIYSLVKDGERRDGAISVLDTNSNSAYSGHLDGSENVTISVTTKYHSGWEQYLKSLDNSNVTTEVVNDEEHIVTASFKTADLPESPEAPEEPYERIPIDVNFNEALYVDGEFSLQGSEQTGDVYAGDSINVRASKVNGDIISEKDIVIGSQPYELNGDIISRGDVTINGGPSINGDVIVGGEANFPDEFNINGDVYENLSESELDSYFSEYNKPQNLNEGIEQMIEQGEEFAEIDSESLAEDNSFESGTYYIDSIDLTGEQDLEFDVSDGDIDLIVRGDIVHEGAPKEVTVTNYSESNNAVRIYTNGDVSSSGGPVRWCPMIEGECQKEAYPLQLYATSPTEFSVDGNFGFNGLIYAPENTFEASGGVNLYGSIVSGSIAGEGHINFVHDESIPDMFEEPVKPTNPNTEAPSSPDQSDDIEEPDQMNTNDVLYLQVPTHNITIGDD